MGTLRFEQLRQARHWLARTMVFALLLPQLLGLLPQPSLSAAAALERDLAWSVCDPAGGGPGERNEHNQQHDAQCILCTTGCQHCSPVLADEQPFVPISRQLAGLSARLPVTDSLIVPGVLRDGSPTRGPPFA